MSNLMFYAYKTLNLSFIQQIYNEFLLHARQYSIIGDAAKNTMTKYQSCGACIAGVEKVKLTK